MKFERITDPVSGQNAIRLDLEGLDLAQDLEKLFHNSAVSIGAIIEKLSVIVVTTYDILKTKAAGMDSFDDVFKPVHTFFEQLTPVEQKKLAIFYLSAHYEILDKLKNREDIIANIELLTGILSDMIYQVDMELGISEKLRAIVEKDIPIPSFTNIGDRPQDSVEMTFLRDEVIDLASIVLLCKMLTPIFGAYIERCKKKMDTSLKEMHCVGILQKVFRAKHEKIILKLENFITKLIAPYIKDEMTYIFNGYTLPHVAYQICAAILTRRFVNVNLYQPNCNLMTYITACARSAITSAGSTASNSRSSVEAIKDPKELHGDDGNTSLLEVESRRSFKTADYLGIIELAVENTILNWINEYDVSWETFKEACDWYEFNPITITPINTYAVALLFHRTIGGAKSVEALNVKTITNMIVLSQFCLFHLGFPNLVPLVSISKTIYGKVMPSQVDNLLRVTWNNTFEYRNINERFPFPIVDLKWDNKLKEVVDYLILHNHIQNLAPTMCALTGIDESLNGHPYQYKDTVMKDMCSLIDLLTANYAAA
jgi:hypothetical protein